MIVTQKTANAVLGALKLARFDVSGLKLMDASRDGFFNSFWAATIIAPFFMLFLGLKWQAGFVEADIIRFVAVEIAVYVMSWVLFPIVMIDVCKHFGWQSNYFAFGTARNWTVLIQNSLYLPIAMADVGGLLEVSTSAPILQIVFIYMLIYSWFVARGALGISGLAATGVVVLDLVIAILINIPADMLLNG
ncbi:MAG: hypothetical protein KAQ66_12255 [Rhodospirillaceae bacterium]|nr:hypothetical protein [Rhodospirillaceae bacterium]